MQHLDVLVFQSGHLHPFAVQGNGDALGIVGAVYFTDFGKARILHAIAQFRAEKTDQKAV